MSEKKKVQAKEKSLASAKRIVVKIGSALLVDDETGGIRRKWLDALADDVATLRKAGKEVVVAVTRSATHAASQVHSSNSSGATGRARGPSGIDIMSVRPGGAC